MRIVKVLGCIALWVWPTLSWAEGRPVQGALARALYPNVEWSPGGTGGLPFLDPDRFHMSQSYSVQFISTGKQSWSTGLYVNTLSYAFAIPLSMQLKVGYVHDPSMLFRPTGGSIRGGRLFIPDFQITYRPKQNMVFQFHYQMVPAGWTAVRFRRSPLDLIWDERTW